MSTSNPDTTDSSETTLWFGAHQTRLGFMTILAAIAVAGAFACHGLGDRVWRDEALTLRDYAHPAYAFGGYKTPINHPLFSASIWYWRTCLPFAENYRTFPLACFLASLALLACIARKLHSDLAALLAVLCFGLHPVTLDFATELRGFGPSWLPLLLGLLFLVSYREKSTWLPVAGVGTAMSLLLGILPTNLVAVGILVFFGLWLVLDQETTTLRAKAIHILLLCALPCLGLFWYRHVLDPLIHATLNSWNALSASETLLLWHRSTLAPLWWLLPLLVPGGFAMLRRCNQQDRSIAVLLVLLVVIPVAVFFLMPCPPFARNLVPLLPILALGVAVLAAEGCNCLYRVAPCCAKGLLFLAPAVFVMSAVVRMNNPCTTDPARPSQYNLSCQYFHGEFHPDLIAWRIVKQLSHTPTATIVGECDLAAIENALRDLKTELPREKVVSYKAPNLNMILQQIQGTVCYRIVDTDLESARAVMQELGIEEIPVSLVEDLGYYKIYELDRAAAPALPKPLQGPAPD